jgi:hypothetical protein
MVKSAGRGSVMSVTNPNGNLLKRVFLRRKKFAVVFSVGGWGIAIKNTTLLYSIKEPRTVFELISKYAFKLILL